MHALFEIGVTNAVSAIALAAIVWPVTRVWRHPALVQMLWVLILLKLVTPPLITIPWPHIEDSPQLHAIDPIQQPTEQTSEDAPLLNVVPADFTEVDLHHFATSPSVAAQPLPTTRGVDEPIALTPVSMEEASSPIVIAVDAFSRVTWFTLAVATWLTGSAAYFLLASLRLLRFHRALHNTIPADDELRRLTDRAAARLAVRHSYQLRITEARLTPLVWPIGRPTIVLSQPLIDQLTREETETLLAHELAHLRRRDHWVRWLELAATTIYWWHPVVWFARRAIQNAEERACDAWVISTFPETARDYASALFKTVQFVTEPRQPAPILASGLTPGGDLKERIEHVMNATWKTRLSLPARLALLFIALAILPLSLRAVAADEDAPPAQTTFDETSSAEKPADEQPQSETELRSETNSETTTEVAADNADTSLPTTPDHPDPKPSPYSDSRTQRELEIERALTTPVSVEFIEVPLEEVIGKLAHTANVDIHLDPLAISEKGIKSDTPVTINLNKEVSLKSALNLILKPLHLTFVVEDEVLKITSDRAAQTVLIQPNVRQPSHRIQPGDTVHVWVVNTLADAPINDEFIVEPGGTVALGPIYGRVKIAGFDFRTAEDALTEHLSETLEDPRVQVTFPINPARAQQSPSPTTTERSFSGPGQNLEPRSPEELQILKDEAETLDGGGTRHPAVCLDSGQATRLHSQLAACGDGTGSFTRLCEYAGIHLGPP